MSQTTKILLAIAVFGIVAACAVCGGSALWLKNNASRLGEEARRMGEESRAWAATHTQAQCVDEAIDRVHREAGLGVEITAKIFLMECLVAATEDPTICDGVPARTDFLQAAVWPIQRCMQRGGVPNDQHCSRVVQGVVEYCSTRPRR